MARRRTRIRKSNANQLYLLRRWAEMPDYSPLNPTPENALWDLYYGEEEEEEEQEQEQEQEEDDEDKVDDEGKEIARQQVKKQADARNRRIVDLIQEWFLENFEPAASGSNYDEYIWGGPFDIREVMGTHFEGYLDEGDELTDLIVEELQQKSAAWVPSGSRIQPPTTIDDPKSPEEAFARTQQNIRALKELLSRIPEQPAGIGHNRPPEPLDDTPLDNNDQRELTAAIQIIEIQPLRPADNGQGAKEATAVLQSKMEKVRSWLARQGDTFATEAVKEAGKQFGKMDAASFLAAAHRANVVRN
jgi:hypothetical protein